MILSKPVNCRCRCRTSNGFGGAPPLYGSRPKLRLPYH